MWVWVWGLRYMRGQQGARSGVTVGALIVPALLALGAGTHGVGGEGAVSNDMTWGQRRPEEHKTLRPQIPTGSTCLILSPSLHPGPPHPCKGRSSLTIT